METGDWKPPSREPKPSACHPPRRQRRQRFERGRKTPAQDSTPKPMKHPKQDSEQDPTRDSTQDFPHKIPHAIPTMTPDGTSRRLRARLRQISRRLRSRLRVRLQEDSEQDSDRSREDSEQDSADLEKTPSRTSRRLQARLRQISRRLQTGPRRTPCISAQATQARRAIRAEPKTIRWRAILHASARYNRINRSSSRRPSPRPPYDSLYA